MFYSGFTFECESSESLLFLSMFAILFFFRRRTAATVRKETQETLVRITLNVNVLLCGME